jgi:membrane protein
MKKTIKAFFKIVGSASNSWWGKDPFMQSAVIAYYAIFSMPGLLVIVIFPDFRTSPCSKFQILIMSVL